MESIEKILSTYETIDKYQPGTIAWYSPGYFEPLGPAGGPNSYNNPPFNAPDIKNLLSQPLKLEFVLPSPPIVPKEEIIIYDFRDNGGQVHLHENEAGLSGGRIYDDSRENFKPMTAFEAAMFELIAQQLEIYPKKRIPYK